MRLLVGHAVNWEEAYGEISDVQDYNLDKPVAAANLLDDLSELIEVARSRGGPAKMVPALEPAQGSAVMGMIPGRGQFPSRDADSFRPSS